MPEPSAPPSRSPTKSTMLGAALKGLVVAALLTAAVRAVRTDNEDAQRTLLNACYGLAGLLLIMPSWKSGASGRRRLLELGWPIFGILLVLVVAARYWSRLDTLTLWPWVYVFLATAFGMVVWGHSLPKAAKSPPDG